MNKLLLKHSISKLKLIDLAIDLKCWIGGKVRGSFAQNGEDLFILDYFKGKVGTYIDIGASHPVRLSNTYLLYQNGWRGVNIEPIPFLFKKIQKCRPLDLNLQLAIGKCPDEVTFFEGKPLDINH